MKKIRIVLLLVTLSFFGCQQQSEYNEVDMDKEIVSCPDSLTWSYSELQLELEREFQKNSWIKDIYIDDTMSMMRINLDVVYKYAHQNWDGNILMIDIVFLLKRLEDMCSTQISDKKNYLVSINHNVVNTENSALYQVNNSMSQLSNYDKPYYSNFVYYVLENMTPSDFQAYDHALEVLYEDKKDERFNTNFYKLILKLSKDNELDQDEEFILDNLTDWALSKPKTETRKHFDYFRSQIVEASKKVDLSK
jgi:hypothetical protein